MKKNLGIIAVIVVVILIILGFIYQDSLRDALPAVRGPKGDIAQQIQKGQNNTDMPLQLPDGFSISVFAEKLGNPRVIDFDSTGTLLASIPEQGKIIALPDGNNDHVADGAVVVAEGLNRPHGFLVKCNNGACTLFVAETNAFTSFVYDLVTHKATQKKKLLDLPQGGNHFTRTLHLLENGSTERMLISIGSTCNVCIEKDSRRTKILSVNLDGTDPKVFASGLRNSVFLANHPVTGKIWATEMGRDLLGDDLPPDEINIIEEDKDYGWPICYGKNIHDTNFDKNQYIQNPCNGKISSHIDLPAHSAPLGLAFVPEEGWPEEYWHDLLIAFHGSWNRSKPTGYKIVRYDLDEQGNVKGVSDFISGWLSGTQSLGRPVDLLIQPGGTLYISDDKAGLIYRLHR